MGFVGADRDAEQPNGSLDIELFVEKIISYTSGSKFTYYYPRITLGCENTENSKVQLLGVEYNLDFIIAIINHLIEIHCIQFEEFKELICVKDQVSFKFTISLRNLLFRVFREEFGYFIKPILNLSDTYIKVDEAFDKYYFLSKVSGFAYRMHPSDRLEIFNIVDYDLTQICFKSENFPFSNIIEEYIVTPLSTKIYSWFK